MSPPEHPIVPIALVALVALAGAALAADDESYPQYVTKLHKGLSRAPFNAHIGPYYIPSGQCSGVLDGVLSCGEGRLLAVQVAVGEPARYARVTVADSLRGASVVRSAPCADEAYVTVDLACAPTA